MACKPSTTSLFKTSLLTIAVSGALVAGAPAWAQSSQTQSGPGAGSTGMMSGTGNTARDTAPAAQPEAKVARGDASLIKDLAQGNLGEIEAGKLALEKSQNPDIKKFAQMMVDDHTKALGEVTALAQSKGVVLPEGTSVKAKAKATALKAMSGDLFDREYAKHAGVGDHEQTVKLLKKIQKDGKDADLKALAGKMLPTVEGHLATAKELVAAKKTTKSS